MSTSQGVPPGSGNDSVAFAERLLTVLNDGALCLMISIGHRTGLFDIMHGMPASTSVEIAARAGLNERYVREWLGAMTTAGVVRIDVKAERFTLPDDHAGVLTRAAGADNVAVFAQYIGLLGQAEDGIVDCFYRGGGLSYACYPRFHEVMAEDSGQSVLSVLESDVVPLVPGLQEHLQQGCHMLDVGCGRGLILLYLAGRYPASRFTGLDLSSEAIAYARAEAERRRLTNISFEVADLSDFDVTAPAEAFDLVTTFDAVHDQAQPLNVLKGIHRALKPDGVYLMQDISGTSDLHRDIGHPIGTFLYTVSCMHCMSVSLAQGGEGLGAMWGQARTRDYLQRAGFASIVTHRLAHDIQNNWYVVRKVSETAAETVST
ncbi:class I SAM-dependent methyltransferase [Salinisphaera sp. SPP-AMP-43]|uniref:class I SAM-dependent methyltransferase n=1 Tax=Salinisphaera sp. SPP-AMP-43 TaxID=3121288 RepID=UPI003C6E2D2C